MIRRRTLFAACLVIVSLAAIVWGLAPAGSAHAQEPAATPAAGPEAAQPAASRLGSFGTLTATLQMTTAQELLAGAVAPPLEYHPAFVEIDCPFIVPWNQEIICGNLEVPENRSNPDSEMVAVFVAILKSLGRPEADPVLVLPEGPGADASHERSAFYTLSIRRNRDIILLDPRGAGQSRPSLDCPELEEVGMVYPATADAYLACHDRLIEEGRDLAGYTTAETVEDVADLAKVLGIGELNLYGSSYGARLAVHLADRYPALVRSMVLDGVLPVYASALLEEPLNLYGAVQRVAQDCAAEPACNGTFPALEARLLEVIDRYNRSPMPADAGYGSGTQILEFLLADLEHGGARVPAFITALYDGDIRGACAALPIPGGCQFPAKLDLSPTEVLTAASEIAGVVAGGADETGGAGEGAGAEPPPWRELFAAPEDPYGPDVERISWLMQELEFRRPGELFDYLDTLPEQEVADLVARIPAGAGAVFSEGSDASVLCAEEAPFYSLDDIRLIAARIPSQFGTLPIEHATEVENICAFWDVPAISPARKIVQASMTPALIVNGTHDPITPPAWARRAAASLDAASVRLFPGYGHAILATGDACLEEMMAGFYANPAREPAHDCFDPLSIDWFVPEP